MEWLKALILGAVQGVTEFLPISSDGHLAITQHFFDQMQGVKSVGAENLFFDVMLHLGTLAAILIHYRAVGLTAAKGVLGSTEVAPTYRRNAVIRTILLSGVATTPLIPLALFLKKYIDAAFGSTAAAGVGFLITAGVLLITMRLQSRGEEGKGPLETTWLDALLIGIAQMFAPLPGVSRSGLTIAAGLSLGLSRAWAVGFSLLIAIPAILGAAVMEVRKVDTATLTPDRIGQTVAAAILAGIVGYGAIIWLVKIVRSGRMWYFSVYLVVLGIAVLIWTALSGGPDANARAQTTAHRAVGLRDPRPSHAQAGLGLGRDLDRSESAGRPANVGQLGSEVGSRGLAVR